MQINEYHESTSVPQSRGKCGLHPGDRSLDFWCNLCREPLCDLCLQLKHQGHSTSAIEAAEARRNSVFVEQARVQNLISQVEETAEKEAENEAARRQRGVEAIEELRRRCQVVLKALRRREEEVSEAIDRWNRQCEEGFNNRRASLAEAKRGLEEYLQAMAQAIPPHVFPSQESVAAVKAVATAAEAAAREATIALASSIATIAGPTEAKVHEVVGEIQLKTCSAGRDYSAISCLRRTISPSQLNHPQGVAVDPNGNTIVADTRNQRLVVWDVSGSFSQYDIGAGEPAGVALDHGGVILTDSMKNQVLAWDYKTFTPAVLFNHGIGALSKPQAVAVDREGRIIVADTGNRRVLIYNKERPARLIGHAEGDFLDPSGVAVNSHNNIIVADTGHHRVQVFDQKGSLLRTFGTEGSDAGQLKMPRGVAVDSSDNIIVADTHNHRLQVWRADGSFSAAISSVEFQFPQSVAVDAAGLLVVVDNYKKAHRVCVL